MPKKFEFDTDAFLADTVHLSATEIGVYSLILIALYRSQDGYIPGDDSYLARVARLSTDRWKRIAPQIRALLVTSDDGDRVSQKRTLRTFNQVSDPHAAPDIRPAPSRNPNRVAKSLKNKDPEKSENDSTNIDSSFLSLDSESESKKEVSKKERARPLPENWQPADAERLYGRTVLKMTDQQIDCSAENMRRWAINNAHRQVGKKPRWDLAFRSWMDRDAAKMPSRVSVGKPTRGNLIYDLAAGHDMPPTGPIGRQ